MSDELRIFDPEEKRPKHSLPQEFYIARGFAKLLSDIGRQDEAVEVLEAARKAKQAA